MAEQELSELKSQMTALSQQLTNQQVDLMKQLTSQLQTSQATPPPAPPPGFAPLPPSAPPIPKLLIGTSILRNVDPNKLDNWEVIAKGGASVDKLHNEINNVAENKTCGEMIIVGGSIDVESKETREIISDYQALAVSASSKTDKLKISSILPRCDKDLKQKTKEVNDGLKSMCEKDGYEFIENDPVFHLMNGNVNDALLVDGLHLTKHGVDSLLVTCGITDKEKSAYTPKSYPKPPKPDTLLFRGHKHPLSNFYEVPITFNGNHFKTSEAAYQHSKAEAMGDQRAAYKIVRSKTGLHAMKIGRKIETNQQWKARKVKIMEAIIKEKIKSSDVVKSTLIQSGSKEIIEDTDHEFWGRGKNGKGNNKLGKMWMNLRKICRENPDSLNDMPNQMRPHTWRPQQKRPQYSRPPYRRDSWATRGRQPKCYQCGESGHGIRQCRKQDTVSCWACGQNGHKRKHCRHESQKFEQTFYPSEGYYRDHDYVY